MTKLIGEQLFSANINRTEIALFFQNKTITYADFQDNISQIQAELIRLSPNKKITVGIHLTNEPFFLEAYFAVIGLGWTAAPLSITSSREGLNYKIKKSKLDLLITEMQLDELRGVKQITRTDLLKPIAKKTNPQLLANKNSLFYLGFTSGSTGNPKAFVRTQASWVSSFEVAEKVFKLTKEDRFMAPGPLSHSLSLFGATHALHLQASFYLMEKFNPKEVRNAIHRKKATVVYLVPTMINALITQERTDEAVTFLSSGAKLSSKLIAQLKKVFPNASVYEYYGASELSFVSYTTEDTRENQAESVGKPFPNVKINIIDKKIYVKSPYVFSHYLNDPAANQNVKSSHGISIGDLGFLKNGLLTLVGREDNLIITGGINVYPEEVEKVLKTLPSIKELMITSLPNDYWGEQIIALVEWHNSPDLKNLKELSKQLPIEMRPRRYYEVRNLPYTQTQKLARHEINHDITRWIHE